MAEATPSATEVADVQSKTTALMADLKTDTAFQAQMKADPVGTLVSKGLPESAARELLGTVLKASGKEAEVAGYNIYVDTDIFYYGSYVETIRDWYDDWGNFLYEVVFVK